jgi:hypothetical protein
LRGGQYWSLSNRAKQQVKRAVNFISDYERVLADEARRKGFDGIVCGHIHSACIRSIDGMDCVNTGDWVESYTAVVEDAEGTQHLIDWAAEVRARNVRETWRIARRNADGRMNQMTDTPNVTRQLGSAVHQNSVFSTTGLLERLFSRLFQGLVYPHIWQDSVADMTALAIQPGEDLFCIAWGGQHSSYLTAQPGTITAVDLSPAHVAPGRLKLLAAQHLSQAQFFDFFCRAERTTNVDLYDRLLARHLDSKSRSNRKCRVLGRRRISMFARGVYRFRLLGRFIGTLHAVSWLAQLDYASLLAARTLPEQKRFFDTQTGPLLDSRIVRWLARRNPWLMNWACNCNSSNFTAITPVMTC